MLTSRSLLRSALGLAVLAGGVLAPATAEAAEVVTKGGVRIQAERMYPTYTTLVVLTPGSGMQLIPNDDVATVDGVPFHQVYWGETARVDGVEKPETAAAPASAAPDALSAAAGGVLPLRPGTVRRYAVEETRSTWVRRGQTMVKRPDEASSGQVRVTVVGAAPEGPVALRESIVEQVPGQPAREVQRLQLVENRADGLYLVGHQVEDAALGAAWQVEERIDVPPLLWPATLAQGQTWVMGPFRRMNAYQVARMEVVGVESVTVPAGTYAEAFRVVGFGHVFGGTQTLREGGRLATDNGTIETTTWIVPGIGPVKEETKIHLHQSFFPADKGPETPFVVEERSTRSLAEFTPGAGTP